MSIVASPAGVDLHLGHAAFCRALEARKYCTSSPFSTPSALGHGSLFSAGRFNAMARRWANQVRGRTPGSLATRPPPPRSQASTRMSLASGEEA